MSSINHTTSLARQPIRTIARRLMIAGVVAGSPGIMLISQVSYAANSGNPAGQTQSARAGAPKAGPHAGPHHNPLLSLLPAGQDDEAAAARVTRFLSVFVPDASDAQKTSIQNIVKAADADLKTLCTQHKATADKEVTLLTAATVDLAALEANRVEGMRLAELISKRKTQGLSDIASVLSAAQRGKMGDLLKAAVPTQPPVTNSAKSPFGK